MDDEDESFDEGQFTCEDGVEEYGEGGNGDGDEGAVPGLWVVGWVVEDDEALDLRAGDEGGGGARCLPTEDAHPAHEVGDEFLVFEGGEFGYPVILAARGRSPDMLERTQSQGEGRETYMDAISAMEVFTSRKPIQQTKNIHIRPAVPPLTRPIVETLVVLAECRGTENEGLT